MVSENNIRVGVVKRAMKQQNVEWRVDIGDIWYLELLRKIKTCSGGKYIG